MFKQIDMTIRDVTVWLWMWRWAHGAFGRSSMLKQIDMTIRDVTVWMFTKRWAHGAFERMSMFKQIDMRIRDVINLPGSQTSQMSTLWLLIITLGLKAWPPLKLCTTYVSCTNCIMHQPYCALVLQSTTDLESTVLCNARDCLMCTVPLIDPEWQHSESDDEWSWIVM